MNQEEIRNYCISKKGVTEEFPFNDTALVFKVAGKMFALLDLSEDNRGLTLKCEPGLALELRERYADVTPAYHFNKKHWNGINLAGNISDSNIKEWIDHSYSLVFYSLPASKRELLHVKKKS